MVTAAHCPICQREAELRAEEQRHRQLLERLRALLDRAELHQVDGRSFIEIPRVDALELADIQHRLDVEIRSSR